MNNRIRILLILFSISAIGYIPFSQWISTTRIGTTFFLWVQLLYGLPLLAAVLGLPVLIVCMFFQRKRRDISFWLLLSILFIPCCIFGIILGRITRMAGMEAFAQRSQPLIVAIQRYERDHSEPPESLNDLVPDYLPDIPTTGMMAYPEYYYHVGAEAEDRFSNNKWALSVPTPSGGINFDRMLYFPDQNYPEQGYGGSLERVGDWAYVHE